jgi:hypothetical protein
MPDSTTPKKLCPGCRVLVPWEHRCFGSTTPLPEGGFCECPECNTTVAEAIVAVMKANGAVPISTIEAAVVALKPAEPEPEAKPELEPDPDAEVPLLPLLLAELEHRDLTPEDFPNGGDPLKLEDQRQVIEKALAVGRIQCAALMATPLGFRCSGGRLEWALKRWLKRWKSNEARMLNQKEGT